MNKSNIYSIPNNLKPNQELIDSANELMEKIKSGELRCMVFAALDSAGNPVRGWAGNMDPIAMMGTLQLLSVEFNLSMMQHLNNE